MSIPLTLTVHEQGGHVYENASLLSLDLTSSASFRDGEIEGEQIELELLTSPSKSDLPDHFISFTDPLNLPDGPFAATVEHEGQAGRIINGVITRDGVSVERHSQTADALQWTLPFRTGALEQFEQELERLRLRDIITTSEAVRLQTSVRYEDGGSEQTTQVDGHWYDVRQLWDAVTAELQSSFNLSGSSVSPGLFPLRVRWLDSNDDEQTFVRDEQPIALTSLEGYDPTDANNPPAPYSESSGNFFRVPNWSALELWRTLKDLHGWVVEVSYEPGSTDYSVEARLHTTFDLPDSGIAEPKFTTSIDQTYEPPDVPDVGLAYDMDVGATAFPDAASYAARTRRLNQKGKPYNRTVERMSVRLPTFRSNTDWSTATSPGPSGYSETLRALEPLLHNDRSEEVNIAELYNDGGTWRTLLWREPDSPASGQLNRTGAVYLWERYFGHALSTLPRLLAEGTIDTRHLDAQEDTPVETLTIGDPSTSLQIAGNPYVIIERTTRFDGEQAEIKGTSPIPRNLREGPDEGGLKEVRNLEGKKQQTDVFNSSDGEYQYSTWEIWIEYNIPSPQPSKLEADVLDDQQNILVQDDDVPVRGKNRLWAETNQGDAPPAAPSSGPPTYEDARYVVVRSVDDQGNTTDGVRDEIEELPTEEEQR
jgi:hypothetical protein